MTKRCHIFLLLILFSLFFIQVGGEELNIEPIDIRNSASGEDVFERAQFFEDEKAIFQHPKQIPVKTDWKLLTQKNSKAGLSRKPFWIKFTLTNSGPLTESTFVQTDIAFLDKFEIFAIEGAKVTHKIVDGSLSFKSREVLSPLPTFEISVEPESLVEVYIKLSNAHVEFTSLHLSLWSEDDFVQHNTTYIAKIAFFSAVALTLGGIWLIFSIVLKQPRFFVYSLMMSFAGAYYLSYSGVSFQFIYSEYPEIHNRLFVFALQSSLTLSFLFFILHLSPSKNGFPYINKVMWTLFFTGSFLALNALFRVSDTLAVVGVMGFSGLAFLNSIFGIRVWLKTRESFAFWFMLGWSMFGISMFAFMLFFSMGIGTKYLSNDIAHEVAQLLILIEGTTLSISLARWFLFQQSQKKQAEIASLTDPLTGLFNRRALDEELESRKLLMANEGAYTLAVVDIDHFKAINDNFGHATGDEVLKNVSFIIKSCIRGNDAAFRIGGEEFLLLLDNCKRSEAFLIIERIRQAFENNPTEVDGRTITHTLSAGLAQSNEQPFEQVLKEADDALYSAKRSGRNRVSFETDQSESSVAIC